MHSLGSKPSFDFIASQAGYYFDISITKQAIQKKICKPEFLEFIKQLFSKATCKKILKSLPELHTQFNRIVVQDSTIIKAPKNLFSIFSGVSNGQTQVANSRIQLAFDLIKCSIETFEIHSYSDNDIKVANQLTIALNDLIIRDRGYFKVSEIIRCEEASAFFIYRYFDGVTYYNADGNEIDILKLLKKSGSLDIQVRVGKSNSPLVRLTACKVPGNVAKKRKEKLIKDAKHTPSKRSEQLQGWTIYITNLKDKKEWTFKKLAAFYGLRWRIEIIFKALKSHVKLILNEKMREIQFRTLLYIKFIIFIIVLNKTYLPFYKEFKLSILKIFKLVEKNSNLIFELINKLDAKKETDKLFIWLKKHLSYDKRKDRKNYNEQFWAYA
jgi:hypothetical protein